MIKLTDKDDIELVLTALGYYRLRWKTKLKEVEMFDNSVLKNWYTEMFNAVDDLIERIKEDD